MTPPKKKKGPPDIPERGDACQLRADAEKFGVLTAYDPESEWATVTWHSADHGPKVVHRFELKRRLALLHKTS